MITLHAIIGKPKLPALTPEFKRNVACAIRMFGADNIRIRVSPRRRTIHLERSTQNWDQMRHHWTELWIGYWDHNARLDTVPAFERYLEANQIHIYEGYADR